MSNKKRIVIYGIGKIFQQFSNLIDWTNVIAIIDGDINKWGTVCHEHVVESPCDILKEKYDYIVICTDAFFDEIRDMLIGEYFVDSEKILSYISFMEEKWYISNSTRKLLLDCIKEVGNRVIDTDLLGLKKYYIEKPLWNDSEKDIGLLCLWGDFEKNVSIKQINDYQPKKISWVLPQWYKKTDEFARQLEILSAGRKKSIFGFLNDIVYFFDEYEDKKIDCVIYTVCHKEFNCIKKDGYKTICVGNHHLNLGDFNDSEGDNIAYLNEEINECTALYWIWKNVKNEYIGINHYRRQLYKSDVKQRDNVLDSKYICEIFDNGYDIILPELTQLNVSTLDNIKNVVGKTVCLQALEVIKNVVRKRIPNYEDKLDYVLNNNVLYRCNIFVMRKKDYDNYCSWLFSFIIECAEEFDVSALGKQEKRVIGYFAEIMLTVWLLGESMLIKEVPLSDV